MPYGLEGGAALARANTERAFEGSDEWAVTLRAERQADGNSSSGPYVAAVIAGIAQGAERGLDAHDQFAPPKHFESISLRLSQRTAVTDQAAGHDGTSAVPGLAAEYRAPSDAMGHQFELVLQPGAERADVSFGIDELPARYDAFLIREETSESFDLSSAGTARFTAKAEEESLRLVVGTTAFVQKVLQESAPTRSRLIGSYPNPFREEATIKYEVADESKVELNIYDMLGRHVRTLVDEHQSIGEKEATFSAGALASGVYLFRLQIGDHIETGRLVQVR